jgi:hypothetical protein
MKKPRTKLQEIAEDMGHNVSQQTLYKKRRPAKKNNN